MSNKAAYRLACEEWAQRTEECWELLAEVKELVAENAQLKLQVEFYEGSAAGWKLGFDRCLARHTRVKGALLRYLDRLDSRGALTGEVSEQLRGLVKWT